MAKHLTKILVFIINLFAVAIGVFFLKEKNDKGSGLTEGLSSTQPVPVSEDVLSGQARIASDREGKLRDLNTAEKTTKEINAVTSKTTTSSPVVAKPSSKASATTKTS